MNIKRYRGFYDDDGSFQWRVFRRHLRSHWHVAVMRLDNRRRDLRALLAGACNASTWNEAEASYDGGYSHWRCAKRRGHLTSMGSFGGEPHRFNNYVWHGPGSRVEYAPLPIRNADNTGWFDSLAVIPFRKLTVGRHAVDTRRRSRLRAERERVWMENRMAQLRR